MELFLFGRSLGDLVHPGEAPLVAYYMRPRKTWSNQYTCDICTLLGSMRKRLVPKCGSCKVNICTLSALTTVEFPAKAARGQRDKETSTCSREPDRRPMTSAGFLATPFGPRRFRNAPTRVQVNTHCGKRSKMQFAVNIPSANRHQVLLAHELFPVRYHNCSEKG